MFTNIFSCIFFLFDNNYISCCFLALGSAAPYHRDVIFASEQFMAFNWMLPAFLLNLERRHKIMAFLTKINAEGMHQAKIIKDIGKQITKVEFLTTELFCFSLFLCSQFKFLFSILIY